MNWARYRSQGSTVPSSGQPSFFEGMNKLVKQTPIETLRYYLAAHYPHQRGILPER